MFTNLMKYSYENLMNQTLKILKIQFSNDLLKLVVQNNSAEHLLRHQIKKKSDFHKKCKITRWKT